MKQDNKYPYVFYYAAIYGMTEEAYDTLLTKIKDAQLPRDTYDYVNLTREDGQKIFRLSQVHNELLAEYIIKKSGITPRDLRVMDGVR